MNHQVVGYCRVSTEEQDLKNQRLEILEYASRNDLKITTWIEKKFHHVNLQKNVSFLTNSKHGQKEMTLICLKRSTRFPTNPKPRSE